jgi:hypothetical protein
MAVHEIRETLQTTASSDNGTMIVQKKINLQPGKRHTFQHFDFFDDNLSGATNTQNDMKMQVYVTNYPVVLSDMNFHSGATAGGLGPLAGDNEVLFKAIRLSWSTGNARWINQEFPNNFLGASDTFTWYTPHLYFTVIWEQGTGPVSREFAMSMYAAVESVDVDAVEYGIGILREFNDHNMRMLVSNGYQLNQADVTGGMPMWEIGGIRPELMTGYPNTLTDGNWFLSQAYADVGGEIMEDTGAVRALLTGARTMVGSQDAFGSDVLQTPDWFKGIVKDFPGLEAGPLRSNFPPLLKNDNGNTEMR